MYVHKSSPKAAGSRVRKDPFANLSVADLLIGAMVRQGTV